MHKYTYLLLVPLLLSLSVPVHTQWQQKELTLDDILKKSKADLIFIGVVDGYARGYTGDGRGDSTDASYKVTKVLKGKLGSEYVNLIFPGHIGFGDGKQVVFATSDPSRVGNDGRARCPQTPCFYTVVEWYLPYSKANEARVLRRLKSKR